jgi:hypothetical protein
VASIRLFVPWIALASVLRGVDLIDTIAFSHGPALASARHVEAPGEHVARIAFARLIAVIDSATASTASVAEIVAVAVINGSGIVSIPHLSLLAVEYEQLREKSTIRIRCA